MKIDQNKVNNFNIYNLKIEPNNINKLNLIDEDKKKIKIKISRRIIHQKKAIRKIEF